MRRLSFPLSIHTHSGKERAVRRHLGLLIFVLFAALTLLLLVPLAAQEAPAIRQPAARLHPGSAFFEPRFQAIGPAGGSVRSLTVGSDGTAYAGAEGGTLFRRPEADGRWQGIDLGDSGSNAAYGVFAVETDPRNPSVVYAGSSHRLYRSADRGESWQRLPIDLDESGLILSIAADPLTPGRVYVGSLRGIHVSEDSGQTWAPSTFTSEGQSLVPDPEVEDRAFALSFGTLIRSLDGGLTWQPASPLRPETTPITAIAYLPALPGGGVGSEAGLYAAARIPQAGTPQPGRLFRSTDGGGSWEEVAPLPGLTYDLIADPADPSRLLLGTQGGAIWTSDDRGLTWTEAAGPGGDAAVFRLAADPTTPGLFYAGRLQEGSLYRSTDGGATWSRNEAGFYAAEAELVGLDPAEWRYYARVAGREPRVRSAPAAGSPNGDGWRPLTGPFSASSSSGNARLLGANPHRPREIFVAQEEAGGGTLYRSRNRGRTWEIVDASGSGAVGAPEEMWFHPVLPNRIYIWQLDTPQGIHRSDDGGDTFTFLGYQQPYLAFDPDDPDLIYSAGTASGLSSEPTTAYAVRSFDGGLSWEILDGVPEGFLGGPIRVQQTTGDVYLQVDATLYRSRDRGLTWQATGLTGASITALAFHPFDPLVLYAGATRTASTPAGLFRSTDGGESWALFDAGLVGPGILSLSTFPAIPNAVFAGTVGGSIQRIAFPSRDGSGPHDCPEPGERRICYRTGVSLKLP